VKEDKILRGTENICLFCGNEKEEEWDEYTQYFQCNCKDAKKYREILEQIGKLKDQLPEPKYEIIKQTVLRQIEHTENLRRTLKNE